MVRCLGFPHISLSTTPILYNNFEKNFVVVEDCCVTLTSDTADLVVGGCHQCEFESIECWCHLTAEYHGS